MRIAVLIKQVPDTWNDRRLNPSTGRIVRTDGNLIIDEADERALEVAISYRDDHETTDIVAVSMGSEQAIEALRKALAIGADSALHIVDPRLEGADARLTAAALAAGLGTLAADLIIAGDISTDGRGGVVPAMVAEHLGLPQLSGLDNVTIDQVRVSGDRTVDTGGQHLHTALPALITVTDRLPEARFASFKGLIAARKKPLTSLSLDELGATAPPARSVVLSITERPPRTAGRIVIDDGQGASELAAFLTAERLI
jgi:electron transfer flavoprotein beta subunit